MGNTHSFAAGAQSVTCQIISQEEEALIRASEKTGRNIQAQCGIGNEEQLNGQGQIKVNYPEQIEVEQEKLKAAILENYLWLSSDEDISHNRQELKTEGCDSKKLSNNYSSTDSNSSSSSNSQDSSSSGSDSTNSDKSPAILTEVTRIPCSRKNFYRDPDEPKNLRNCFVLFCQDGERVKNKMLLNSGLWKMSSEEEKQKYRRLAEYDKIRYTLEIAGYMELKERNILMEIERTEDQLMELDYSSGKGGELFHELDNHILREYADAYKANTRRSSLETQLMLMRAFLDHKKKLLNLKKK